MNNRKNQNSLLVLATLGVYLGLVLVGATPTVWAQAATAKLFDVKDEIEKKDGLDKNPAGYDGIDGDIAAIESLKIPDAIRIFISDLKKLESIGKYSAASDWAFSHSLWFERYGFTFSTSVNSDIYNPWVKTAVDQLISTADNDSTGNISDLLPRCNGSDCRESKISVITTANDFSLSFSFTKSTAEKAKISAERFNRIFVAKRSAANGSAERAVYEATKVNADNDQVTIVTRLPRAGLDSLLASDAK